jgi:hypothetical protein
MSGDALAERLAFEELHRNEGAVAVLANFVDCADVRVVGRGGRAGFPLKAFESLWVVDESCGKKFQSDVAAESEVLGLVHFTHTPSAELSEDAVVRNGLSDERVGVRHSVATLAPSTPGRVGEWRLAP